MTQQAISYYEVPSWTAGPTRSDPPTASNGTVPPSFPRSWNSTLNNGDMQPLMKAAVYSGLLGNSSIGLSSSCSPGNSTYRSLGICASCRNLTSPILDPEDFYRPGNGPCFRGDDLLGIDANLPLEGLEIIVNASYFVNGETPRAGECALSWCLRTFPIRVDENSTINITYYIQPSDPYTLMPTDTSTSPFYVDVQSSNKISDWMKSLLTGRLGNENWHGRTRTYKGPIEYPDKLHSRSESSCPDSKSSDAISALGNPSSGTIENKFHYIAAAMTEQIQSTCKLSEPMTSMGNGQAIGNSSQTPTVNETQQRKTGEWQPIIHVQWAWLALPTSLVVLALILQIVTMVRTSRRDTPVWKSSTLALVFHGRGEVQEGVVHHLASAGGSGIPDDIAGMEDVAARIKVRLEYTGRGGWCLRQERPRLD